MQKLTSPERLSKLVLAFVSIPLQSPLMSPSARFLAFAGSGSVFPSARRSDRVHAFWLHWRRFLAILSLMAPDDLPDAVLAFAVWLALHPLLARSSRAAAFSGLFCSGSFGCSVTSVSVVSAFSDVLAVSFCCAWWFCSNSFCWPWCQCSQKLIIPMSLFQFFNSNFKIKCKFQRVLFVFFEMTWTFWMKWKNPRNRTKMEKGVNKTCSKNRLFWCLVLYF